MLSVTKKRCLILLLDLCKVYNTLYFFLIFPECGNRNCRYLYFIGEVSYYIIKCWPVNHVSHLLCHEDEN